MDRFTKDFLVQMKADIARNLEAISSFLDGADAASSSPPATPPVFLPPKTWHAAATDGKFTLYIKGGDCPAQMMPDAPATPTNGGDAMKYLTKRSDGRWQGSKVIDGKREFVYARTQAECRENSKISKKDENANRSATAFMPLRKTGLSLTSAATLRTRRIGITATSSIRT